METITLNSNYMIDNATKTQIAAALESFCDRIGSQNKASIQMGISGATISNMIKGKWENQSDDMWRKISSIIGYKLDELWSHAETVPFLILDEIFTDAKEHANVYGIIATPGSGKTYTVDYYRRTNPDVFYVKCERHTTEGQFLKQLLLSMGKPVGFTSGAISAMLSQAVSHIERTENPVILIDEIEKVKNDTLFLFIDLYNAMHRKAGLILLGTPNLKTRIDRGVLRGRMCYNELLSRIGGRFVEIPAPTPKDGAAVIRANGFNDPVQINAIINDSDIDYNNTDGKKKITAIDLRRVERLVHKEKLLLEGKAA